MAKKGNIEIPNIHAIWLTNILNSKEFKEFISKYHEDHPNDIFSHKNLANQTSEYLNTYFNENYRD